MVKSFTGGQIVPGDLIAISNGNYMTLGVAAGEGKGTLQYWSLHALANSRNWYDNDKRPDKKPFNIKNLWKCRILSTDSTRIMIINESVITTEEEIEKLQKAKEILTELQIPFNF